MTIKDEKDDKEPFVARWSRLKRETNRQTEREAPARAQEAKAPAPELPPIDKLTIDSDYRAFFHPKVGEDVRRAALKKLFSDPHFNVMDGLDVYIDDYSKADPIPAAMLAGLKRAQQILDLAKDKEGETAPDDAASPGQVAAAERPALEREEPASGSAPKGRETEPAREAARDPDAPGQAPGRTKT